MRSYTKPSALIQLGGPQRCGVELDLASANLQRLRNCHTLHSEPPDPIVASSIKGSEWLIRIWSGHTAFTAKQPPHTSGFSYFLTLDERNSYWEGSCQGSDVFVEEVQSQPTFKPIMELLLKPMYAWSANVVGGSIWRHKEAKLSSVLHCGALL